LDLWSKRLGSWFFTRDGWEDFENDYWQHVAKNLDDYYSNFVSRFVIEFAGLLMPWWRVSALDGARREYFATVFSDQINLAPFHEERLKLEAPTEAMFFQDSFPEYRRVLQMSAVTQTDPPWVEMEGFKLTHPERGQKLQIFRDPRKICGFYGQQTHGATTGSNQELNRAGLGDSPDRPATQGQPQHGSQLRADLGTACSGPDHGAGFRVSRSGGPRLWDSN
jgi:hypothetical protein